MERGGGILVSKSAAGCEAVKVLRGRVGLGSVDVNSRRCGGHRLVSNRRGGCLSSSADGHALGDLKGLRAGRVLREFFTG